MEAAPADIPTHAARISARRMGAQAVVLFDCPDKLNALDAESWQAIPPLFETLAGLEDLRLVILRGAGGRAFVAGADMSDMSDEDGTYESDTAAAFDAIAACPLPTLAAIEGVCMGGGLAIATACDLRLARDDARFAVPAARRGIAYPPNAVRHLRAVAGVAFAREILYLGQSIAAEEAHARGLVNRLATEADFDTALDALAARIASNAPLSLRAAKYMLDDDPRAAEAMAAAWESDDRREGLAAFREKREPDFKGR